MVFNDYIVVCLLNMSIQDLLTFCVEMIGISVGLFCLIYFTLWAVAQLVRFFKNIIKT